MFELRDAQPNLDRMGWVRLEACLAVKELQRQVTYHKDCPGRRSSPPIQSTSETAAVSVEAQPEKEWDGPYLEDAATAASREVGLSCSNTAMVTISHGLLQAVRPSLHEYPQPGATYHAAVETAL